jgi:hypothetical protein
MDTGFADAAGFTAPEGARATVLPPDKVAKIGLDALYAGKSSVVAGGLNRAMALATRLVSRHRLAEMVMQSAR